MAMQGYEAKPLDPFVPSGVSRGNDPNGSSFAIDGKSPARLIFARPVNHDCQLAKTNRAAAPLVK
jgi:hypothetical protein